MAKAKICKQCGKMKPLDGFRPYYGNRTGTYNTCLDCEKINTREKYLRKKSENTMISASEAEELEKIHLLYKVQRAAGLQPPRLQNKNRSLVDELDDMITMYNNQEAAMLEEAERSPETSPLSPATDEEFIPAELQMWRTNKLTKEPEYYQDTVYEGLREKYRPIKEIDQKTMMPVYDNTYKYILDEILARFDAYEDEYYSNYKED
jgi:hypothetical protein